MEMTMRMTMMMLIVPDPPTPSFRLLRHFSCLSTQSITRKLFSKSIIGNISKSQYWFHICLLELPSQYSKSLKKVFSKSITGNNIDFIFAIHLDTEPTKTIMDLKTINSGGASYYDICNQEGGSGWLSSFPILPASPPPSFLANSDSRSPPPEKACKPLRCNCCDPDDLDDFGGLDDTAYPSHSVWQLAFLMWSLLASERGFRVTTPEVKVWSSHHTGVRSSVMYFHPNHFITGSTANGVSQEIS